MGKLQDKFTNLKLPPEIDTSIRKEKSHWPYITIEHLHRPILQEADWDLSGVSFLRFGMDIEI